jgi:ribosomal protein L17
MESKEGKELYGDSETWKEVYAASQQIKGFNTYFREMIRSKINFDQINHLLEDERINFTAKKNKNVRKVLNDPKNLNLENEKKARSVGGSVQEYVMSILTSLGTAAEKAASTGTRVFSSEIMKADTVTLFSYEASIDSGKMA